MSDGIAIPATTTSAVQDKRAAGRPEGSDAAERDGDFATVLESFAGATDAPAAAAGDATAAMLDPGAAIPAATLPPAVAGGADSGAAGPGRGARGDFADSVRNALERGARGAPVAAGAPPAANAAESAPETTPGNVAGTGDLLAADDTGEAIPLGPTAAPAARAGVVAAEGAAPVASATIGAGSPPDAASAPTVLPRERPAPLTIDARLPVHQPEFGERFSQQLTVLVHHGIQHAHLSVSPPELGPVDVRITLQHDEATVQLASPSLAARDAMQDALPRLRELLEQAGVRLNDAGVYADLPQRGAHGGALAQERSADGRAGPAAGEGAMDEPAAAARRMQVGLIDAYV